MCVFRSHGRRFAWAVLTFAASLPGPSASPTGDKPSPRHASSRVYVEEPVAAAAVRNALAGASRRLEDRRCGSIFSSPRLRDAAGRALHERFVALRTDAPSYMGWLVFADGSERKACRTEGVLAVTHPGSRVVYVCGLRFRRAWMADPRSAEAAIIHEALHTLGLGENPPSSGDITRMVRSYCYP